MRYYALLLALFSLSLDACGCKEMEFIGSCGWGANDCYQKKYQPEEIVRLEGKVLCIYKDLPCPDMCYGVILYFRSGDARYPVHLGPSWFLEHLAPPIERGERLVIEGGLVKTPCGSFVVAHVVEKLDGSILTLRGEDNWPVWVGWKNIK